MKSTPEIRLENLKLLVDEAGGASELAKKAGYKQPSYIYQILNQSAIQNGKPKNIGKNMAAKLEAAMGKPDGWMDIERATPPRENELIPAAPFRFWSKNDPLPDDEYVFAPFLKEVEFVGGAGAFEIEDHNGFQLPFGKSTLYRKGINIDDVFCCTLSGDSMENRISEDATIAIDQGDTHIRDGKIYAFQHDDLFRVKYLFRLPGGQIRIKSENDFYKDEIVSIEDVHIIGRVFWWAILD